MLKEFFIRRMLKEVSVQRSEEDMRIDDNSLEPEIPEDDPPGAGAANNQHKSSVDLGGHPSEKNQDVSTENKNQESPNRPAIDSKPQIRVRAPPGGKSSIFF